MIKGVTKTGFTYELSKERLDNYEMLEAISELDENPLVLPRVVNLLLGKEQAQKLKEHVRTKDGLVPAETLSDELKAIFEKQNITKNS